MSIKRKTVWETSDGRTFESKADAQAHETRESTKYELTKFVQGYQLNERDRRKVRAFIWEHRGELIAILQGCPIEYPVDK